MKNFTPFEKKVFKTTERIPRGRVSTYGEIAKAIRKPRAARAVGNALNENCFKKVPCHRVVKSDGRIGGFARGSKEKALMLEKEGVAIRNGRISDFKRLLYKLR